VDVPAEEESREEVEMAAHGRGGRCRRRWRWRWLGRVLVGFWFAGFGGGEAPGESKWARSAFGFGPSWASHADCRVPGPALHLVSETRPDSMAQLRHTVRSLAHSPTSPRSGLEPHNGISPPVRDDQTENPIIHRRVGQAHVWAHPSSTLAHTDSDRSVSP
jgi:hypothetical protein